MTANLNPHSIIKPLYLHVHIYYSLKIVVFVIEIEKPLSAMQIKCTKEKIKSV